MSDNRTRLMNSIKAVNEEHKYVSDSGDEWNITPVGDCEDYSFAVLWDYSGKSWFSFIRNILFGPFRFWYLELGDGPSNGHFMTEYKPTGEVFDNNWRKLVAKKDLPSFWKFKYSYFKLKVLLRLIFT